MEPLGISLGPGPCEEITETLRVLQTKKVWEPLTGAKRWEVIARQVGAIAGFMWRREMSRSAFIKPMQAVSGVHI